MLTEEEFERQQKTGVSKVSKLAQLSGVGAGSVRCTPLADRCLSTYLATLSLVASRSENTVQALDRLVPARPIGLQQLGAARPTEVKMCGIACGAYRDSRMQT